MSSWQMPMPSCIPPPEEIPTCFLWFGLMVDSFSASLLLNSDDSEK